MSRSPAQRMLRLAALAAALAGLPAAQAGSSPHAAAGFGFDSTPISSLAAPGPQTAGMHALAEGDFDGDGSPDFASVPLGGAAPGVTPKSGVAVYLGKGDGTFSAPVEYPAGPYPIDLIAARLRGPAAPLDLVVSDAGVDAAGKPLASILLGNGDGTFQPPLSVSLPATGYSPSAGDFDGDGKLDLALSVNLGIAAGVPRGLTILLGNGDGTFGPPARYEAGTGLSIFYETAVADVDRDGALDFVGMDPNGLWLSLGNGDGSFLPGALVWADPTTYVGGQVLGGPDSFAVGDLNGDGVPDVALDVGGARVDVLLGTGTGAFAPAGVYDVREAQSGSGGGRIEAADLGGDGSLDLVVATGWGATLAVLQGNGDGTFRAPAVYPLPGYNDEALLVADVDRDGSRDVVVGTASGYPNYLTALLNLGDGTFPRSRRFSVVAAYDRQNVNPVGIALGRFDGDAALDLAVTVFSYPIEPLANGDLPAPPRLDPGSGRVDTGGSLAVLLGNGDGTFGEERQYAVGGRPIAVAAADLTGDGREDLAVANIFSNTLSLLQGNGDGTFRSQVVVPSGTSPNALALADFDRDGRLDFAVSALGDNAVAVLLNRGELTFSAPVAYPVGVGPNAVRAGDFDGDGRLDLAVTGYGDPFSFSSPSTLTVLLGGGDGTFRALPAQTIWPARGADALGVGDFDGDGTLDLAAANFELKRVLALLGRGDGTFAPAGSYLVGAGPESIAVADFDGDGALDLAVDDLNDNTIALLAGRGDGSFVPAAAATTAEPQAFGWPAFGYPTFLAAGDLTGDGRPDLVTANLFDAAVTVLRNTSPAPPPPPVCFEDDDPRVAYDPGWHTVADERASAGHFRVLPAKGGQHGLSFGFETRSAQATLEYAYATSTKGGSAELYVDGRFVRTLSFRGESGSLHSPAPGASTAVQLTGVGEHAFELRDVSGAAYVDRLCLTEGSSEARPQAGPGATAAESASVPPGGRLVKELTVPAGAQALSVVAESSLPVPFRLVLLDPAGRLLASADAAGGVASVQAPVPAAGAYLLQLVNLAAGPVELWSAATPHVSR